MDSSPPDSSIHGTLQAKLVEWVAFPCPGDLNSVQFSCSFMSDSLQLHEWQHARPPCPSTNSRSSLKLTSIESVMPYSHLFQCHPLLLLPQSLPASESFPMSQLFLWGSQSTGVFFRFSIIPSKEHPGLISFRMDWLDLLAVQGTLKSLLQHHSSKASILQHSAFFTVPLLPPYMITGKTIDLSRQAFVGKLMSLLLNTLSRLVITFLPRS